MPRKYRRVQFPVILATFLVAGAGLAAVFAVKRTHDSGYWMSGLAVLVPLVLGVAGKVMRPVNSPADEDLDAQAKELRDTVLREWNAEVELRISVYPLPVPFSAATTVTGPVTVTTASGARVEQQAAVTVTDSWAAILRDPDRKPPSMDGKFGSIADVFGAKGLPSRLVVLGDPGSGKSILAQWLTVRLLSGEPAAAAGNGTWAASSKAVPVLLPLTTWDPSIPLKDWAAMQMARSYPWLGKEIQVQGRAGRTLAGLLLDQGRVLMVLDGLDEVAEENRLTAFRKLSEAARQDQAMVITCRTREYAQVVHDARQQPMPRTPVIRLHPLPLKAVRTYLDRADAGSGRLRQVLRQVDAAPRGQLAQALTSPLALWLVATVYRDPDKNPAELARYPGRSEILKHLLDGLVTAVYSAPAGEFRAVDDPEAVARARRRLVRIADYLGPDLHSQNIDWWRLPMVVPSLFTGGLIGTLVGCVLGAAVGLAAAARFSVPAGIQLGIVFGIITGTLAGITSVRPQDHPRTVEIRFRWDYWRFVSCLSVGVVVGLTSGYSDAHHGGLLAGLVTGAVVGPVCAAPCIRVFGWAPGSTAGITAAVALGLSSAMSAGNGHPALSGLAAGLVFTIAGWIFVGMFQPAEARFVVSPQLLLDRDRVGSLTVAVTAGIAFGVLYGVALGPVFAVVALVALTVSVSVTVSIWAAFNVCRVWLALTGMVPVQIMAFLHEAYCRGVLRQVGGSYQFRHTELKEALLTPAPAPPLPAGGAGPAAGRGRRAVSSLARGSAAH
jgi:hypothetical protein